MVSPTIFRVAEPPAAGFDDTDYARKPISA
jgi:hypothetical protein